MEQCITLISQAVGIFGTLAFLVSIVTQVTKKISCLKRIPTDLQVIVLSVLFAMAGCIAYFDQKQLQLTWWIIAGSVVGGFFVAFIAMYGWNAVAKLMQRFGLNTSSLPDVEQPEEDKKNG